MLFSSLLARNMILIELYIEFVELQTKKVPLKIVICISESFIKNISDQFFDYTIILALEHNFKRYFFTQKPDQNVPFKDFCYKNISDSDLVYTN